jgi:hypothetical protein
LYSHISHVCLQFHFGNFWRIESLLQYKLIPRTRVYT